MIRFGLLSAVLVLASTSPVRAEQPMSAADMAVAHRCAMPKMKADVRCAAFKQAHANALAAMPKMSRDGPDMHRDAMPGAPAPTPAP